MQAGGKGGCWRGGVQGKEGQDGHDSKKSQTVSPTSLLVTLQHHGFTKAVLEICH